jgi:hypothetical protein
VLPGENRAHFVQAVSVCTGTMKESLLSGLNWAALKKNPLILMT